MRGTVALHSEAQVKGGETYDLEFWIKSLTVGPSYFTQYRLQWLDRGGRVTGGTGFVEFKGQVGIWSKVEVSRFGSSGGHGKGIHPFSFRDRRRRVIPENSASW